MPTHSPAAAPMPLTPPTARQRAPEMGTPPPPRRRRRRRSHGPRRHGPRPRRTTRARAPSAAADARLDDAPHGPKEHHMNAWDAAFFLGLAGLQRQRPLARRRDERTYGLMDDCSPCSNADADGTVTRAEWDAFIDAGKTLPDLGTGPGHHGDAEYEYEIHHWEKIPRRKHKARGPHPPRRH
ncbi:conserved hypothetical protein [Verticillium alfalfae VaMs.102]|uniref:EF-hand domain-containing protein n=1 Tax=Verticillium alfalfae (strain VaMs.102 / ATCC MYA-4576 / FGSC 10136) TaxID=526221 RepID=C9SAD6_VERA1|nr:conserved hypothetical protein [Verticillium alfalfae VaMs.102]EEY15413.1 conserved hypothetical protein [Verticillium alfalfae VaMs.102]